MFAYECHDIVPVRIAKQQGKIYHIDLLLLKSENKTHYTIGHFVYMVSLMKHYFKNRFHIVKFMVSKQLNFHRDIDDCFLEFKDYEKTLRVPYVIYADFETLKTL